MTPQTSTSVVNGFTTMCGIQMTQVLPDVPVREAVRVV